MSDKEYYKRQWHECRYRVFQFLLALGVAAVSMSMCSCKSTELSVKSESMETKDSIRYIGKVNDSLSIVTIRNVVDSIVVRDSLVIVVDSSGNVLQAKEWHVKENYHNEQDSTAFYKLLARQAISELVKERNEVKEVYVEKKPTKWQQLKIDYGGYAFMLVVLLFMCAIYRLIRFISERGGKG